MKFTSVSAIEKGVPTAYDFWLTLILILWTELIYLKYVYTHTYIHIFTECVFVHDLKIHASYETHLKLYGR